MKIGTENGRIYVETKDYDSFYMKSMPCQRFITLGEAVRLRKDLDDVIATLQPKDSVRQPISSGLLWLCPKCNKEFIFKKLAEKCCA